MEQKLGEIRITLSQRAGCQVVAGLGGMGKTLMIMAYTKRYQSDYSAVFG